jgi:hypothetical protein
MYAGPVVIPFSLGSSASAVPEEIIVRNAKQDTAARRKSEVISSSFYWEALIITDYSN